MAKWGEGDPRWIVEKRADGTNVNNWHWVEKNATAWSKGKITDLLTGLVVENDDVYCEIKEVNKVQGEASTNNRKGKLIIFYEWDIDAKWTGNWKNGKKHYKGTLNIPNLSEENDISDVDLTVTVEKTSDEAIKVKEVMRKQGVALIREKLGVYIQELRDEYSQGVILPSKDSNEATVDQTAKVSGVSSLMKEVTLKNDSPNDNKVSQEMELKSGVRISTKKLSLREEFKCQASDLYRVFTDQELTKAFSGSDVKMQVEKGGQFSLYGGNVTGQFVDLQSDKKIVQKWRMNSWPKDHYSTVKLDFEQTDDCTILKLTQTGIPTNNFEQTCEGWKTHYFHRIMGVFGFGVRLL